MDLKVVQFDKADGVGTVMLNRPERLNAWTGRMELEYRWCMQEADADPDVRVIVLTGAGRGFCSGADFQALDRNSEAGVYSRGVSAEEIATTRPGVGVRADFEHPHTFMLGLRKPVIAAVNGPAAGVGFVLMAFADIRFAAAGAKLTTAFGRLGLPAEHGVAWILSRTIGPARAADLLFSARVVLAEEAAAMGLVNQVVAPEELMAYTYDYARAMARDISPVSLLRMKRQLYFDLMRDLGPAAAEALDLMEQAVPAHSFKEGVAAFQEKRAPNFSPLPPP